MFNFKAIIFAVCIVGLLSLSVVSAADNITDDIYNADNDQISIGQNQDIVETVESSNTKTFTNLQEQINNVGEGSTITLDSDYKYDEGFSKEGISISKKLTIDGNNHIIDGDNQSRIFKITIASVEFKNIVFINGNGNSSDGGAILGNSNIVNCTFINNHAVNGGAVKYGQVENCTFINTTASGDDIVLSQAKATNSIFINSGSDENTFTFLQRLINEVGETSTIVLAHDYEYDDNFNVEGITINVNSFTINGNGYRINGLSKSRLFNVTGSGIVFKNLIFVNGNAGSGDGGAIVGICSADNCTFINNTADKGGALNGGSAVNCIFTDNFANDGNSMYNGTASKCTFSNSINNNFLSECNVSDCSFKTLDNDEGKFSNLKTFIDQLPGSNIQVILTHDYSYDDGFDVDGIVINAENMVIYGEGHKLDGLNKARIFKVNASNVVFRNMILVNANAGLDDGGAIVGLCSVFNCTFINNTANKGGALKNGYVENCIFINNTANMTATLFNGSAKNCVFIDNKANDNKIVVDFNSTDSIFYTSSTDSGTFSELQSFFNSLNGQNNFTLILTHDYSCDDDFHEHGLSINSTNVIFDGKGHTIDALHKTRILNTNTKLDISNIIFTNGNADNQTSKHGGAISSDSEISLKNCTFINNAAVENGGAIFTSSKCSVENCTFINNTAVENGGAVYSCDVFESSFINNYATKGSGIYSGSLKFCNLINTTVDGSTKAFSEILVMPNETTMNLSDQFLLNLTLDNETYNGYDITLKVYQNQTEVSTIHALSGQNLTFDLNPGYYDVFGYVDKKPAINATMALSIFSKTTIFAYDFINIYASPDCYVIKMLDEIGNGINGITVSITLGNNTGNYTTDEEGQVILSTKDLTPGLYGVEISYEGNGFHSKADATSNIIINKAVSKLIINTLTLNYGDVGVIRLTDALANPINNATILIDFNGIENYTTDENGEIKISTDQLTPGTYSLNINFTGNDYYLQSNITANLTINKSNTNIVVNSVTATYNVNKNLIITLKDINGKTIPYATVNVNLNGNKYYTTDKNGQIKIPVQSFVPKTYAAKISFNENTYYLGSVASVNVVVKKATPKISAKSKKFKAKLKSKKYSIVLKNNKNQAMKKVKLTLKVKGKKYVAKTNSKGKATFKITKLTKKGKFTAVISYKGNNYYNKLNKKIKIRTV